MTMFALAIHTILAGSLASARLPDPNLSAKEATRITQDSALNYLDNPSAETSQRLKDALKRLAAKSGGPKTLNHIDRLSEADLQQTAKVIKLAATCEIVGYSESGLIAGSKIIVVGQGGPSASQIAAFLADCPRAKSYITHPQSPAGFVTPPKIGQ